MGARIGDWLGLLFVVVLVYILVRPGSKAAQLIEGVTSMLASMVRAAVDLAAPTG